MPPTIKPAPVDRRCFTCPSWAAVEVPSTKGLISVSFCESCRQALATSGTPSDAARLRLEIETALAIMRGAHPGESTTTLARVRGVLLAAVTVSS